MPFKCEHKGGKGVNAWGEEGRTSATERSLECSRCGVPGHSMSGKTNGLPQTVFSAVRQIACYDTVLCVVEI